MMYKVLIDADACPRKVMEMVHEVQGEHGYDLVIVSSFNHRHSVEGQGVYHVYTGDEDQAADLAVINRTLPYDIVVTQDWGLAAVIIGKGARALDPNGRVFTGSSIDFLLEERHLKAKYRRGGGRTKGPAARTKENDRRFTQAFLSLLSEVKGCGDVKI